MENTCTAHEEDECPALDLIANHYADVVPEVVAEVVSEVVAEVVAAPADLVDNDDDDDLFELIQIDSVPDFPLLK